MMLCWLQSTSPPRMDRRAALARARSMWTPSTRRAAWTLSMILLHLRPTVAPPVAEPQSIDRSCCNELNVTFADDHELFPNVSKVDAGWGPGSKTLLNSARGLYHAEPVVARNPNTKGAFGVLLLYTHATHTSKWRIYRQETPTTHKAVRLLTSCPACESPASAQLGLGLSAAASLRASRHTGLIAPQPRVSQVWVLGECNPSHRDTCGIMNLQARAIGFSDAKCAVDVLPDQWKVIDASNAAVASPRVEFAALSAAPVGSAAPPHRGRLASALHPSAEAQHPPEGEGAAEFCERRRHPSLGGQLSKPAGGRARPCGRVAESCRRRTRSGGARPGQERIAAVPHVPMSTPLRRSPRARWESGRRPSRGHCARVQSESPRADDRGSRLSRCERGWDAVMPMGPQPHGSRNVINVHTLSMLVWPFRFWRTPWCTLALLCTLPPNSETLPMSGIPPK
eukprot:1768213-Prymnesium_polylepis.1